MLLAKTNLILLSFLALTLGLYSCSGDKGGGQTRQSRPVPVRTIEVQAESVEQTLSVIGHVEPSASVHLTAQVGGQLMESWVKPGSQVKAGAVLFKLDPRSFQAKLNQTEASLKRERAQLKKAKQDLERYRLLASKDFLSQQQYEQSLTEVESLDANIAQSEAVRENAQLDLSHTTVIAPISGRVGEVLIDPGNNIKANETVLLIINTIRPADVRFSVPERFLPELKRRNSNGKVIVNVLPEGDQGKPIAGELSVIDNEVDRTTGTIAMRARFTNSSERLWPGQFVRVSIVMDALKDALVVPQSAVLEGLSSRYVYVVTPDGTLSYRNIKSGDLRDGRTIIHEGLSKGEIVVTDGQLNLAPSSHVEIVEGPSPTALLKDSQAATSGESATQDQAQAGVADNAAERDLPPVYLPKAAPVNAKDSSASQNQTGS